MKNARLSALFAAFLIAALPIPASVALGMGDAPEQGSIQVLDASLHQLKAQWFLDAQAEIELGPAIRAGLDSGVPLIFIVELQLDEPRTGWFNTPVLDFKQRYSLNYYELTRHYRLQRIDTKTVDGSSRNFRSLLAALDDLGSIHSLYVGQPSVSLVDSNSPQRKLLATLSIQLDSGALPLPLQPLIASTWSLASEDYAWWVN